jgi:hypothetical protein
MSLMWQIFFGRPIIFNQYFKYMRKWLCNFLAYLHENIYKFYKIVMKAAL